MVSKCARLAFAGPLTAALLSFGAAQAEDSQAQKAHQQKMKDCGALWQKAKAAGKTGGRTWNEFAAECLKGKN